jgi:hypothetical protein
MNPTHRQNRIFMHNISRKDSNHQIFQNSKKHKNLKNKGRYRKYHGMRRNVQRMPKSREKSARKTHNMT